jgi:hypothetical protein
MCVCVGGWVCEGVCGCVYVCVAYVSCRYCLLEYTCVCVYVCEREKKEKECFI